ncbi:MAG: SusD/RagB family nutrient-binding outer membrane lipoprotein [Tunicatimonas sp.]
MKYLKFYSLLIAIMALSSCDEGFDELNTNEVFPTAIDPSFVMNDAILSASVPTSVFVFELAIVQQVVTPNGSSLAGANFNQNNRGRGGYWENHYPQVLKSTLDVLDQTQDDPELANLYNMARIWRAYAGMVLTDTYGDVPFSEAGLGFIGDISNPKYDPQQDIYNEILTELSEASAALSDANPPVNEVLYGGDITKWKRLGYSLMLRAAMRLTEVAPQLAQQYTQQAVAGGLMESNADNAAVVHTDLYRSPVGNWLNGSEANNYFLVESFVDFLQENDDPRLGSIAVRYVGATNGAAQKPEIASLDPEVQIGFPMGFDNSTIGPVAAELGLASFYGFSQLDRSRLGKQTAPSFLVTHSLNQLLLAEAAVRGWVEGDAATYFSNGIRAHMEQMASYDPAAAIAEEDIAAYLAAQPLEAGRELEQINTQYWVASFMNSAETFANFRRSDYPELTPNPYPGSEISTDFILRLTYPDSEAAVNAGSLSEAVSRQGPDALDTRVWWDVD